MGVSGVHVMQATSDSGQMWEYGRSYLPQHPCVVARRSLFLLQHTRAKRYHSHVSPGAYEARTIFKSLDLAWELLRLFPRELLRRISVKTLDKHYER